MRSRLFFSLINNLQVIEKLAETRPIRRAAQITIYAIIKAQIALRNASERALREQAGRVPGDLGEMGGRLRRVRDTFVNEVMEGLKTGTRKIKK